jgi:hypothetical protein
MQPAPNVAAAPVFLPLVEAAALNGIGRTKAFELAAAGIIETFTIGTRRYAVLESIRTLPERMKSEMRS